MKASYIPSTSAIDTFVTPNIFLFCVFRLIEDRTNWVKRVICVLLGIGWKFYVFKFMVHRPSIFGTSNRILANEESIFSRAAHTIHDLRTLIRILKKVYAA